MTNLETIIKQIGLSENEAKVYLASLELGESSMTDLSKKANLKRPTTYLAVDQLELLGLISKLKKGKRNTISPVHPRRLVQIAKFREKDIEDNLPKLLGIYEDTTNKPKVQMFEGKEALDQVYRSMYALMEEGKEALWVTKIDKAKENFDNTLEEYKKHLKRLRKPMAREMAEDNEQGRKWLSEINDTLGTNEYTRLLPKESSFGDNEILIIGDKVALFAPGKEIFVIVIENPSLAKTFRAMYELVWQTGKPLSS